MLWESSKWLSWIVQSDNVFFQINTELSVPSHCDVRQVEVTLQSVNLTDAPLASAHQPVNEDGWMDFLFGRRSAARLSSGLLVSVSDAKTRKRSLRGGHPLSSPPHLDQGDLSSPARLGKPVRALTGPPTAHVPSSLVERATGWCQRRCNPAWWKVSRISRNGQSAQSSDHFTNIHWDTWPFNQPTLSQSFLIDDCWLAVPDWLARWPVSASFFYLFPGFFSPSNNPSCQSLVRLLYFSQSPPAAFV